MDAPTPEYDYDQVWDEVYGDIQRYGPGHHHLHRIFRWLLRGLAYENVLDVGCGPGHNYALLTRNGAVSRFDGIDISGRAVEAARRHVPGRFWQLDIQEDCVEETWDLVVCSLVLEHVRDDDAAIRNLRRMAGRHLLVASIAGDFERYRAWDETQGHVRNYHAGELEDKLRGNGFAIRRVVYWGFPFYSPLGRILQNRGRVGVGAFTWKDRLVARAALGLYYLNSWRRGDMVVILAEAV